MIIRSPGFTTSTRAVPRAVYAGALALLTVASVAFPRVSASDPDAPLRAHQLDLQVVRVGGQILVQKRRFRVVHHIEVKVAIAVVVGLAGVGVAHAVVGVVAHPIAVSIQAGELELGREHVATAQVGDVVAGGVGDDERVAVFDAAIVR